MYNLFSFIYSIFESAIFLSLLALIFIFILPMGWLGLLCCVILAGAWPFLSYIFALLSYPLMKVINKHGGEKVALFVFSVFGIIGAIAPWVLLWFFPSWSNAACCVAITTLDYDMFNGAINAVYAAKD